MLEIFCDGGHGTVQERNRGAISLNVPCLDLSNCKLLQKIGQWGFTRMSSMQKACEQAGGDISGDHAHKFAQRRQHLRKEKTGDEYID